MTVNGTRWARGHITLVQEQRFRLVTDTGQGLLLTLSHKASLGAEDLQRLHRNHTPVMVFYDGPPDLASGVAREVRAADAG